MLLVGLVKTEVRGIIQKTSSLPQERRRVGDEMHIKRQSNSIGKSIQYTTMRHHGKRRSRETRKNGRSKMATTISLISTTSSEEATPGTDMK